MQADKQKLFSLAAIVVAAVLFGMVLAGGLNLTPGASADKPAAQPSSTAPVAMQAPNFADLADRVVPSVVSVYAKNVVEPDEQRRGRRMPMDPFHFFFGPGGPTQEQQGPIVQRSAGSGFFISPDGELITNNHVVEGADELEIELEGGRKYAVEVVGRDPATDIALIKVKNADRQFPYLTLGNSDAARVGEWVMAVGNPLNMDHTVTVGVVSAKGRVLGLSDTSFENYIQTDAAINLGNSGGPLVNTRGEVIGINTAINVQGQNLGFAVPVNTASLILPQLRSKGKVVRGYLGVSVGNVTPELQQAFNLPSRDGAFVQEVVPDHAAAKAGLQHGDVILAVDGHPVEDTRALIDRISSTPPGTTVKLEVFRNGEKTTMPVVLEERTTDEQKGEAEGEEDGGSAEERVGITVSVITPQMRQSFDLSDDVEGVVITKVDPVSAAADAGLRRGDIITEVNGHKVTTPEGVIEQVKPVKAGEYLRLYVYRPRADRSFYAIVKMKK